MTDIRTIKDTLEMQYSFEKFLELYNEAPEESEKLCILYQVIDYVENSSHSLDRIKQYLSLQPEKFEPFLTLVSKIDRIQPSSASKDFSSKKPVKVEVYTFMEQ